MPPLRRRDHIDCPPRNEVLSVFITPWIKPDEHPLCDKLLLPARSRIQHGRNAASFPVRGGLKCGRSHSPPICAFPSCVLPLRRNTGVPSEGGSPYGGPTRLRAILFRHTLSPLVTADRLGWSGYAQRSHGLGSLCTLARPDPRRLCHRQLRRENGVDRTALSECRVPVNASCTSPPLEVGTASPTEARNARTGALHRRCHKTKKQLRPLSHSVAGRISTLRALASAS